MKICAPTKKKDCATIKDQQLLQVRLGCSSFFSCTCNHNKTNHPQIRISPTTHPTNQPNSKRTFGGSD